MDRVNVPHVVSIEKAVMTYYEKTELREADILALFGCSRSKAWELRHAALSLMKEKGVMRYDVHSVETECAYEAWGLNIADLEKRLTKLRKFAKGASA